MGNCSFEKCSRNRLYRGIGFKSVVNLAKSVYIFSGEFAFYFDKNRTLALLPNIPDVPLVRIPHLVTPEENDKLSEKVAEIRGGLYTTLFVFLGIDRRIAEEELSDIMSKNILFTGAGFTHDFGGILAQEMWSIIFNHPKMISTSCVVMRALEARKTLFHSCGAIGSIRTLIFMSEN